MRKILYSEICVVTIFLTIILSIFSLKVAAHEQKPKIALVLSGGGAKGAAHIGVLKLLDEIGLKVDYIIGTSMGALVGGLYSAGYTGIELERLISAQNWKYLITDENAATNKLFRDKEENSESFFQLSLNNKNSSSLSSKLPSSLSQGQNISTLLSLLTSSYGNNIDFALLPIPFACVATDLANGNYVVLKKGSLPLAMRASMSIPDLFAPINYDNYILVDGGVTNNFPVNVAKQLGADYVIGVDVQTPLATPEQLNNIGSILNQLVGIMGNQLYEENLEKVDILISPYINNFSTFSFTNTAISQLIANGYKAAEESKQSLIDLKTKPQNKEETEEIKNELKPSTLLNNKLFITDIKTNGLKEDEINWILKRASLSNKQYIDSASITHSINLIYGTSTFSYVRFYIDGSLGFNRLVLDLKKRDFDRLGFGLNYNSEEAVSLLFKMSYNRSSIFGTRYTAKLNLSINPYIEFKYTYAPRQFAAINTSYKIGYTDMNIYSRNISPNNYSFLYNQLKFYLSSNNSRNTFLKGGVEFENYNIYRKKEIFLKESSKNITLNNPNLLNLFAQVEANNQDDDYYPTKGIKSCNIFKYHPTAFSKNYESFATASINISASVSPSNRFTISPSLYSRFIFGTKIPIQYSNYAGGELMGRYYPQQLPFSSINNSHLLGKNVIIGSLSLRERIGSKNYISLIGEYLLNSQKLKNIISDKNYIGVILKYSYNSFIGPLSANIHYSNYTKEMGFYINIGCNF